MWLGVGIVVVVGLGAWVAGSAWIKRGVAEPPFDRIATDGEVEVRRYGETIVAATEVEGEREEALNEGFRRLAGYIFGKNRSRGKIAMTAPVSAVRSEKIAMTAPVSAVDLREGAFRVTFAMPAGYTLGSLPVPDDPRVLLEVLPGRDVAAIRFRGWAGREAIEEHTAALLRWASARGRDVEGSPVLAQYDPPFAMPLMRRNEILLNLR
ncbi:MAG: heme-binding protein [Polyangiaceae bacterium]